MAQILKPGMPAVQTDTATSEVQATVASLIAEVKKGGDAAVRALSVRLDGYGPPRASSCRGKRSGNALVASVSKQT